MRGLLLHDLYSMKRGVKTYAMFLAFFAVLGMVSGNGSFFASFVAIYSMMFGISIFSYHEVCNWDVYANTLPVTRRQIVGSFYQLAMFFIALGSLLSFCLNLVMVWMGEISFEECMITLGVIVAVGILMLAVDIPLLLKFGSERGRLIMMGSYVVLFLGFAGVCKALSDQLAVVFVSIQSVAMLAIGSLVVAFVCLAISYRITLAIYQNKEF